MKRFDVAVIGGGLLGCFAARNLRRWNVSVALLEGREDVCTGISRANSAIIYPGYDNEPGSLKAKLTAGKGDFIQLCRELEVPYSACGSLMVCDGPKGQAVLEKKLEHGRQNGVEGLRILSGAEAREREPALFPGVRAALYAPTAGTVNPWELGIAAFENAVENGCEPMLGETVLAIERREGGYVLTTSREELFVRFVVNCAGLASDKVQELLFPPSVRIFPDGGDYLVLDKNAGRLRHILLQERENGKGINAVPTVEGNILLGPSVRPLAKEATATTRAGLDYVRAQARALLRGVDTDLVIRSFAAVRPRPYQVALREGTYVPCGGSIGSFVIAEPAADFLSFIGIKTPGLSCADELGKLAAGKAAAFLAADKNEGFSPCRKAPVRLRELEFAKRAALVAQDSAYGEIVCRCEDISLGEIRQAIRRGAVSIDGVKRRTGSGMGRCQGSRCRQRIAEMLAEERGAEAEQICQDGPGSPLL